MALALVLLSIIDFYTFKIPSCLNIFIGILGLIRMGIDAGHRWDGVAGFFSVSLFLGIIYIFTKGKSIGGGDIKLMAVSGLMLGWQRNILAFFIGALLALVIHSLRMVFTGTGRRLALWALSGWRYIDQYAVGRPDYLCLSWMAGIIVFYVLINFLLAYIYSSICEEVFYGPV